MPKSVTKVKNTGGCCDESVHLHIGERQARETAELLQALGHPIRLQILDVLAHYEGQACVCHLTEALPVKQPTISHHLRLLREAGLVGDERRGPWSYYHLERGRLDELRTRLDILLAGLGTPSRRGIA
jgi:ArsR family transcriptional regulator